MTNRISGVCLVLAAAGCAAKPGPGAPVVDEASNAALTETYQLTADEQKLDCKKLTGLMQVRILQERDYSYRRKASASSQAVQSAGSSVLGASTRGLDPEAEHRQTIAQLRAYNARLAEKNCKTFDLDKELEPKPVTVTPTPVAKPETTPGTKKY